MSKIAVVAALSAVVVLGACAKHRADPAPMQPITEPVYVEPVSSKTHYR